MRERAYLIFTEKERGLLRILAASDEPLTARTLARRQRASTQTIYTRMKKLTNRGAAFKRPDTKWRITPLGVEYLRNEYEALIATAMMWERRAYYLMEDIRIAQRRIGK